MGSAEDDHHCSLLESLPARPPTPPRETASHDLDVLSKHLIAPQQLLSHPRSLQTPPGVLSPTTSSGDSTARRKRVGFSSQAQYQDPPIYTDPPSRRQQQTPLSLPSSSSRPVKSILKQTAVPNRLGPANGVYLDIDKPGQVNIAAMLESTLQQLAGADRESKVDAYIMLFRALKASSNLPDRIALQEKMGLFMQFIQRDLSYRTPTGTVDIPMVTSALKLLHTFLHFPGIASSIPVEFGMFFVEHCVRSFEDEQAPKEVVRHLMQALYLQNFSLEVMSLERVGRLVTALHNIENHLSRKSIIQSRIHVYEKLVPQCPQQMAAHSDWLQDLFTDMLSSAGEIRSAAARLGLDAAFTLNKDKRLVGRVLDLLNLSLEDKKYVEHIIERLGSMLQNKDESQFVPRIWSVITLFIPSPDQWDRFKPWLDIIKRSFNHSNLQTRKEANLAWSRVTYRLFLDRRLDHKPALRLIREPLLSQLRRKGLRDSVLGAIRNFYYYALRPEMNLRMLNEVWEMGVTPLLQRLINSEQGDKANMTQAAAILTGLLDCKTRRVWREDRIKDPMLVKDDELPAIESKWIRANPHHIFELVGPILAHGFAGISVAGSPFRDLWRALVQSVASASTKDVKLHDDTAKFVAEAFTFLLVAWKQGPRPGFNDKPCTPLEFLDSTRDFVLILVEGLGLLPNPFTGIHFVRTKEDQFLPSAPTQRSVKSHGSKRLPLHHLFLLFCHLPPGIPDDNTTIQFFDSTFAPFFTGKNAKAQADLAQELLRLLPMDAHCPCGTWVMCATKMSAPLERSQHGSLGSSPGAGSNTGLEYRDMVKLLERGLKSSPNLPWTHWNRFFQRLTSRLRDEVGDAGVAVAAVEQLAGTIEDMSLDEHAGGIQTRQFDAAIEILAVSTHPRDKQALDAAKRRLWGSSNAGARHPSFDPFDNMYRLLVSVLERVYGHIRSCDLDRVTKLLSGVESFFERAHPQLELRALIAIQTGLMCWLEDEDHRITKTDVPGVPEAVRSLWQRLCKILAQTSADNLHLATIEPLFCAAFRSTHREIIRFTAEAWNRIYEDREQIDYPEALKTVLASLGSAVEITRPGLEIPDAEEIRHNFIESQDEIDTLSVTPLRNLQPIPQPRPSASRPSPAQVLNDATEIFNGKEQITPEARTKSKGHTPKPKLRHEDSQLQFAAIEFSPIMIAQESQLLTDRQQEIRERQQETAAMFPEIRSSPTEKTKKAQSANVQQPSVCTESLRALTPEREGDYEDCLTSTPTPRRGRPISLPVHDQEMTDPPSSPPEPRTYRLLAELKSQATSNKSLVDWQFSSSPVSGSPNLALQAASASQSMELDEVDEELRLDDETPLVQNDEDVHVEQETGTSSQPEVDTEIIEETILFDPTEEMVVPAAAPVSTTINETQSTPSGRRLRSSAIEITPKSDNDEFVDAPSSPLPPTPSQRVTRQSHLSASVRHPSRQTANSQLFDVSPSFENGMRNLGTGRIEIPLRSSQSSSPKRREYKAYSDILSESPEQALDSIEVAGAESNKPRRGRSKKTQRAALASQNSQPTQSSQPPLNIQAPQGPHINNSLYTPIHQLTVSESLDSFENVSPGNGKWLRKRRRSASSSVYSSGGGKKARHDNHVVQDDQQEVPDSQPAAAAAAAVKEDHRVQLQTAEELHANEVSLVSNDGSSPIRHEVSEEPPATEGPVQETQPQSTANSDQPDEPMGDADEQTDDEEAIHSQLTREEHQASGGEESPIASRAISPAMSIQPAEVIEQEAPQGVTNIDEPNAESGSSTFDSLMNQFKNGLETLRSVGLTREQFYQAENVFFEMRNELLEAERRGRR